MGRGKKRVTPSRYAAVGALVAVERGKHLEDALASFDIQQANDRAQAWFLARGVLQRMGALDFLIDRWSRKPAAKLDVVPRACLRLAFFELRFGRAPERAVVHEAVEACRAHRAAHAAGFVNAVLRKHDAAVPLPERLSLGHPEWWLTRWEQRIGVEATRRWAESNNQPKPLTLVQRSGAADVRALFADQDLELVPSTAAGEAIPGSFECAASTGDVSRLAGFEEGAFWVQDAASTAVADLVSPESGKKVLDACAGRGGKSFRLADRGFEVVAADRRDSALAQLQDEAGRLGLSIVTHRQDWTDGVPEEWVGAFDAVLLDAPCTALGTLRRHPDVRWTRTATDPLAMSIRQSELLDLVAKCVRPGGQLVYAVCSPEPEEGQEVADGFTGRTPLYRIERLWKSVPPQANEDAFFGASWIRGRPGELG